eukprot:9381551-Alexandrium_andersonii.AAC.1
MCIRDSRLAVPILCHTPRSTDQMTAPAPPTPLVFRVGPPPSKRMYVHASSRSVGAISEALRNCQQQQGHRPDRPDSR